jgi:hypothetical protein
MTNRVQIRRASDDKVIEIDPTNSQDIEKVKEFCKGTNGHIHKWYNQAKKTNQDSHRRQ